MAITGVGAAKTAQKIKKQNTLSAHGEGAKRRGDTKKGLRKTKIVYAPGAILFTLSSITLVADVINGLKLAIRGALVTP